MTEFVLSFDELPPSANDLVGQGSRWRYTKAKKHWGGLLGRELTRAQVPPAEHVLAEGRLTFPTRAKHDQGNYRFLLEKALGDALQAVGVLVDDHWAAYEFGGLGAEYEKGVSRTEVLLMLTLKDA